MENIDLLKELMVSLALLTPISTGLTEVIKRTVGWEHARFLPLISVLVGGASALALIGLTVPAFFIGVISGLSGTGLWEVGKSLTPETTV